MQAIVLTEYGGPEVLRVSEVDDPVPGPEEVLIRVRAAGVNRADLLQREGRYPPPAPAPKVEIPGLECAGEVVAVGARVSLFKPGQRVAALVTGGAYAEKVAVHERLAWPVPAAMTWAEAAAVPEAFLTGYDALTEQAGLMAGQWVLIHAAAGGVGSAAVQLATWMGIHVVATVGSAEKAAWVRGLGADHVVDYRQQKFLEVVRARTPGMDAVLDLVGQTYWDDNLQSLAPGGVLVVVGTLAGDRVEASLGMLLGRRLTVRGTALRSRPLELRLALVQRFIRRVLPTLVEGRLKPLVDTTFPLLEAGRAHAYMRENRVYGKIVLTV